MVVLSRNTSGSQADQRVLAIFALPLDSIGQEQFAGPHSPQDDADMLGPPPESAAPLKIPRLPSGLPVYLASLYAIPLLSREQEAFLFRKMNYLRYKASELRATLDAKRPDGRVMDQIESLYDASLETRNQIIRANLRLVVSIAKRHVGPAEDFFELVSDGNLALFRAVEKFDVVLGNRFCTYATCAILRTFARSVPTAIRQRYRFRAGEADTFRTIEDNHTPPNEQESKQLRRESFVRELLLGLNDRERQIITSRFALSHELKPLTLRQIGATMGITKERVRQIETRTMGKLREAADEMHGDFDMASPEYNSA